MSSFCEHISTQFISHLKCIRIYKKADIYNSYFNVKKQGGKSNLWKCLPYDDEGYNPNHPGSRKVWSSEVLSMLSYHQVWHRRGSCCREFISTILLQCFSYLSFPVLFLDKCFDNLLLIILVIFQATTHMLIQRISELHQLHLMMWPILLPVILMT